MRRIQGDGDLRLFHIHCSPLTSLCFTNKCVYVYNSRSLTHILTYHELSNLLAISHFVCNIVLCFVFYSLLLFSLPFTSRRSSTSAPYLPFSRRYHFRQSPCSMHYSHTSTMCSLLQSFFPSSSSSSKITPLQPTSCLCPLLPQGCPWKRARSPYCP